MKNVRTHIALTLTLFALLSATGAAQSSKHFPSDAAKDPTALFTESNSIAGSWYVRSTPDGGSPFRGLLTFDTGGGVIASAQGDNLVNASSLATAGHGAWKRTGNREFIFTFRQIIYNPDGGYEGEAKIRHVATLSKDGKSWVGNLVVEILNSNDEVVFTGTGSGGAERITAEPLH